MLYNLAHAVYWLVASHVEIALTSLVVFFLVTCLGLVSPTLIHFLDDPRSATAFYGCVDMYCCAALVVRAFARFSWLYALVVSLLLVYTRARVWQSKQWYGI